MWLADGFCLSASDLRRRLRSWHARCDMQANMASTEVLSPHAVTQRTAATDHAIDVINNLPHLPRLVLLFAYCEGMTMGEIGRSLGVDEGRVRVMHDEALKQLKVSLAC
jgi:RNA polymerase sigma factor (sigma-70 family)